MGDEADADYEAGMLEEGARFSQRHMDRAAKPARARRDKIERLRTRLKQVRGDHQGTQAVVAGILDYLADEAND